MTFTRRELIKLGLVSSGMLLAPTGTNGQALADGANSNCKTLKKGHGPTGCSKPWKKFESDLPVPKILKPNFTKTWPADSGKNCIESEVDYYQIEMTNTTQCIGGKEVNIWGYNDHIPGPTIYRKRNVESVVRFINNMGTSCPDKNQTNKTYEDINAVIHLHGMASLPQYDGYADDFIPPGWYKDYHYPNDRAATIWYHDHVAGRTQRNVGMGLAGMYIIEGPTEERLKKEKKLPGTYGHDDIPLIVQTNPLYVNIDAPKKWDGGVPCVTTQQGKTPPGETDLQHSSLLMNGELQPVLEVQRKKYRFRVLNATDMNGLALSFATDTKGTNPQAFTVIGTDGGLMNKIVEDISKLPIGMGERYEIIVDFDKIYKANDSNLTEAYLYNSALSTTDGNCVDSASWALMKFKISPAAVNDPITLPTDGVLRRDRNPEKLETDDAKRVTLTFQGDGSVVHTVTSEDGRTEIYEPTQTCQNMTKSRDGKSNGRNGSSFVIGNSTKTGTVGKSWMDGEPLTPFPPDGTAPVYDPKYPNDPTKTTQLPNAEKRVIPHPDLCEVQVWKLINETSVFHPVHIHLLDTYMLDRSKRPNKYSPWSKADANGVPYRHPWEENWKDVYFLGPGERIRIIGKYGPHKGRYMLHCHNLFHEDCDMMVEFEVGKDGDSPLSAPAKEFSQTSEKLGMQPPEYNYYGAINKFNANLYGPSSSSETLYQFQGSEFLEGFQVEAIDSSCDVPCE